MSDEVDPVPEPPLVVEVRWLTRIGQMFRFDLSTAATRSSYTVPLAINYLVDWVKRAKETFPNVTFDGIAITPVWLLFRFAGDECHWVFVEDVPDTAAKRAVDRITNAINGVEDPTDPVNPPAPLTPVPGVPT